MINSTYIVADTAIKSFAIREFLAQKLPEYMIPAHFIRMDQLPLTPNGKVNLKLLPEPDSLAATDTFYEAPRDLKEEKLVELWQKVLEVQRVGIHDDFFALGGHSLKAMLLLAKIQQQFDLVVPLKILFSFPTVKALSEYMKSASSNEERKIEIAAERDYYPSSSAQQRMYVLSQRASEGIHYNISFALIVEGPLDYNRLEASLQLLMDRHESLRTTFLEVDGEVMQQIHSTVAVNLEWFETDPAQAERVIQEFIRPFDLHNGPLFRSGVIKVASERHILLMDMHHSISDGISVGIIMKELMDAYQARKLPQMTRQYKDYAVWQRQFLHSESISNQEAYWLNQFQGELPILKLPLDYPRPAVQSFVGDSYEEFMEEELVHKARQLGRETGSTLFMTMLATFNIMLSKHDLCTSSQQLENTWIRRNP